MGEQISKEMCSGGNTFPVIPAHRYNSPAYPGGVNPVTTTGWRSRHSPYETDNNPIRFSLDYKLPLKRLNCARDVENRPDDFYVMCYKKIIKQKWCTTKIKEPGLLLLSSFLRKSSTLALFLFARDYEKPLDSFRSRI